MTPKQFGKIIRDIREETLQLSQTELAKEMQTTQTVISRLEKGKGGTLTFVFKVIDYLKQKGIKASTMFDEANDEQKGKLLKSIKDLNNIVEKL